MNIKALFTIRSPRPNHFEIAPDVASGRPSISNKITRTVRQIFSYRRSNNEATMITNMSASVPPPPGPFYTFDHPKHTVMDKPKSLAVEHSQVVEDVQELSGGTIAARDISEQVDSHSNELEAAMAEMRAAEKLLEKRHTAIRAKPQPNIGKKVIKTSDTKENRPLPCLPTHLVTPSCSRRQPHTVNEAIGALRRRDLIKELAYNAVEGCPTAIATIESIRTHSSTTRGADMEIGTSIIKIYDSQVNTRDMGLVERNWIARYSIVKDTVSLLERRLLGGEDCEAIFTQLFPDERGHLLKPEYFTIFMTDLGKEGIFNQQQAKEIARLSVSVEEFEKGAHFQGATSNDYEHYNNPATLVIFDIPKDPKRVSAYMSPQTPKTQSRGLYNHLRILVEAAVYDQKYWKGYFFANARSKLNDYHQADKLSREDCLLPPSLSGYTRDWTFRETRLLQRGQLICDLLALYESDKLNDFGIIRAIRGTFVPIPGQPFFGLEDLESFLCHRIVDSGLPISKMPTILALHSENDSTFANARLRHHIMESLEHRAKEFEKEEQQRLRDIETSHSTFESARRTQMTPWQRMKTRMRQAFGRKKEVVPFDPFAPEHEAEKDKFARGDLSAAVPHVLPTM